MELMTCLCSHYFNCIVINFIQLLSLENVKAFQKKAKKGRNEQLANFPVLNLIIKWVSGDEGYNSLYSKIHDILILEDICPVWGVPCFGLLVTCPLCFNARLDSMAGWYTKKPKKPFPTFHQEY